MTTAKLKNKRKYTFNYYKLELTKAFTIDLIGTNLLIDKIDHIGFTRKDVVFVFFNKDNKELIVTDKYLSIQFTIQSNQYFNQSGTYELFEFSNYTDAFIHAINLKSQF